jgi:small-conductance mechanosensitive channel
MTPLLGSLSADDTARLEFVGAGLIVLVVFIVASRLIAHTIAAQLVRRNVRTDMVVLGRRVAYVLVIGFGVLAALGLATRTANVTLVGILLATVVTALGVQELLRDYVSGYYILLERHIRIGDRIGFDEMEGTVAEVRLRVTLLRSDEGNLIVVPNSELFTKSVTVYTKKVEEPPPPPPGGAAENPR